MNLQLIGCGGIGGWVATLLSKSLAAGDKLELVDGDRFEEKNIDRQFCRERHFGRYKAEVLKAALPWRMTPVVMSHYFSTAVTVKPDVFLLCAADNHGCRRAVLEVCDRDRCKAIIMANEYEGAEAYAYFPSWKGTPRDPRVYYPEIKTDASDDPLRPPCTGVIVESHPQLPLANMLAATGGLWLLRYWTQVHPQLTDDDARSKAPVHIRYTAGHVHLRRLEDYGTEIRT